MYIASNYINMEKFVAIKGFEGRYEISDLGRVKSLERKLRAKGGAYRIKKEKMLSLKITKGHGREGYHQISLKNESGFKHFMVHRLVALHFIPNPENKEEVNHKFGVRSDNRVTELEWMTRKENMKHAYDRGSWGNGNMENLNKGSLNHNAKLTEPKVENIIQKYNAGNTSTRKLAKEYGVHHAIIFGIISGKRWGHVTIKKEA